MTATPQEETRPREILTSPLDKLPQGPRSSSLIHIYVGIYTHALESDMGSSLPLFRYIPKREKMDVLAGAAVTWFTGLSDFSGLSPQVLVPYIRLMLLLFFFAFLPLVLHFESLFRLLFLLSFASEQIFSLLYS